jgi:hypothetical protein
MLLWQCKPLSVRYPHHKLTGSHMECFNHFDSALDIAAFAAARLISTLVFLSNLLFQLSSSISKVAMSGFSAVMSHQHSTCFVDWS